MEGPRALVVDLLGRYSKLSEQIKRIQKIATVADVCADQRLVAELPRPRKVSMRLSDDQLTAMVQAYAAGATGGDLAVEFGIARSTVIQVLKQRGVNVRRTRVGPDETALVVALYQQGWRQIEIAGELGRSKSQIWHLLKRAGAL